MLFFLSFFFLHIAVFLGSNKLSYFLCLCRSMAVKLEKEVTKLRENLQQAVDRKLKAERENKDTQELVNNLPFRKLYQ